MIVVAAHSEPLSMQLAVSLSRTEKAAVGVAAKASGLSMSAWARQAISAALLSRRPS